MGVCNGRRARSAPAAGRLARFVCGVGFRGGPGARILPLGLAPLGLVPLGLALLGVVLLGLGLPPAVLAAPGKAPAPATARDAAAKALAGAPDGVVHSGPCDASAAIPFGNGLFVVVDNKAKPPVVLRIYRSGQAGPALGKGVIPADAVAPVDDGHPALDLEAAARIGPLVYWIGSHGAGAPAAKGKGAGELGEPRPNQRRLFATNLGLRVGADGTSMELSVEPVGRPYTTLIDDLAADPRYARFELGAAATRPDKAKGGLSIEGLAATPSGALLIGFRNPLPGGKALLVPLTNPNAVLGGEKARFGDPVLLDLGGLGIRSLEMVNGGLLIVAGPAEGRKGTATPSVLYRWSGQFESPAVRLRSFPSVGGRPLNPEALVIDGNSLVVLSDDGKLEGLDAACGKRPKESEGFRELRITPVP
ncbi:MAG: DUF3616 domain-containing protein [Cyanobacteria bacterium]|nr:DUF3616 domain-containing protein [Cyanobacteriota bacterium]